MTYCTVAEAKREGATGTDVEIGTAISVAQTRIEQFTGDVFEPVSRTVAVRVSGGGRGPLPYRLTTEAVTSVTSEDGTVLAPSTYKVFSSAVDGETDAIGFGTGFVGANMLVVGLEPWADYASQERRVRVTAMFGWASTPVPVRLACAKLAADVARRFAIEFVPPGGDGYGVTDTDPEGNVVPVVPPFPTQSMIDEDDISAARTTGFRSVDAMLIPYRRHAGLTSV